jgi:ADP-ribose pyrophosphatase YjhB (NUDIX family)
VGIAPHIARLRAVVGHEPLLLPSVALLPADEAGRLLLVKETGHDDGWHILGGAVDMGESPAEAAVREAREEIGVGVRLVRLIDVLGGPDYEVRCRHCCSAGSPAPCCGQQAISPEVARKVS